MEERKLLGQNYGIDILKILAMFFVLVQHMLSWGGILGNAVVGSSQYYLGWLLEAFSYCAVDAFALATGFLMVGRTVKYKRMLSLWLTVQFYNVLLLLVDVFLLRAPFSVRHLKNFLPILSGEYWYFTAYAGLFLFMPFLNKLLEQLDKKAFCLLAATGFTLFCLPSTVFGNDLFGISSGYSLWWLMYLYILGAGIKKFDFFAKWKAHHALMGYLAAVMLSFLAKVGQTHIPVAMVQGLLGRMILFVSPTILLSAVFLLAFCLKLRVSPRLGAVLTGIRPLVFQVYIIHLHFVIWEKLWKDRFAGFAEGNALLMTLYIIGTAAGLFLILLFVDWLRSLMFRLLGIEKGIHKNQQ